MRIFGLEIRSARGVRPAPDADYWYTGPAYTSSAGVDVTEDSAMRYSTVWSCVKVISEDLASLPLIVYRREGKSKQRATDHPLYPLLHDRPNPEMTAMQWREALQGHLLTYGNAYSEIQRNLRGEVMALWPLDPSQMQVTRDKQTNELVYKYNTVEGKPRLWANEDILHVAGLGFNGLMGYSPVSYQSEAIGAGIAGQQFQGSSLQNSGKTNLAIVHPAPKAPSAEGRKVFREELQKTYGGPSNAGKILVLWEGMEVKPISISPADMQFIDSRKYSRTEICGIFRVPPHLIGDLERATFSNIEEQSLEYVKYCLRPWCTRWEQQINARLLGASDEYFVEHLVDGLLRGDLKTRYDAYAQAIQNGWLSPNDARSLENLNPIEGGDQYFRQANLSPLDTPPPEADQQTDNIVAIGGRK